MVTMKALLTVDEYNWLKDYLSVPWMKDVEYIQKLAFDENAQNFIRNAMGLDDNIVRCNIAFARKEYGGMSMPFDSTKYFKGLEYNMEYSLEELGLDVWAKEKMS